MLLRIARAVASTLEPTLLKHFMETRRIAPAQLERETGFSKRQVFRWRFGASDIRRGHMVKVLCAIRRITGENVELHDLFVVEPNVDDCGHVSHA